MEEEIWKDIPDYEGLYWISNYGKVKNKKGKILKPEFSKRGYYVVDLYKKSQRKRYPVHKLVAIVFVPNKNKYNTVIHIDKNTKNNFYKNLLWCNKEDTYFSRDNKGKGIIYKGKKYNSIMHLYEFFQKKYPNMSVTFDAFSRRIKRWSKEDEIINIPTGAIHCSHGKYKLYYYNNKKIPFSKIYEIALKRTNIKYATLLSRLYYNWTIEEAIEIPVQEKRRR